MTKQTYRLLLVAQPVANITPERAAGFNRNVYAHDHIFYVAEVAGEQIARKVQELRTLTGSDGEPLQCMRVEIEIVPEASL